jgi:hypothetical protein
MLCYLKVRGLTSWKNTDRMCLGGSLYRIALIFSQGAQKFQGIIFRHYLIYRTERCDHSLQAQPNGLCNY